MTKMPSRKKLRSKPRTQRMPRAPKAERWAKVVEEAQGDKTKLYTHEGTLQQDDPPPGSQARLDLIRGMAIPKMTERKRQEAAEAAKTPEQRQQDEADRREQERRENLRLKEEARHQERQAQRERELSANLDLVRIDPASAKASAADEGYASRRGPTGGKVGRPLGSLKDAGKGAAGERTRRGRLKWLREHPSSPAGCPARVWEACTLVYGHLGNDGEAGRRMTPPLKKQQVERLRQQGRTRYGIVDPRPY